MDWIIEWGWGCFIVFVIDEVLFNVGICCNCCIVIWLVIVFVIVIVVIGSVNVLLWVFVEFV